VSVLVVGWTTFSTTSGASVPCLSYHIARMCCVTHLADVRGVVSSSIRSTCSRTDPCLRNEDVCVEKHRAQRDPRRRIRVIQLASFARCDHVWGDDSDNAVPEPIAGSGERNTTRTNGKRKISPMTTRHYERGGLERDQ